MVDALEMRDGDAISGNESKDRAGNWIHWCRAERGLRR
jgi:hypothetical protein